MTRPCFTSLLPAAAAVVSAAVLTADPALACSVCGGDPESPMARGATQGVLVMAGVAYVVLMGMAWVGATWILRARRLSQAQAVQ